MEELAEAHKHEVPEFDVDEDDGFDLYGNCGCSCKARLGSRKPHPQRAR